jgi:hypothetical protein
VSNRFAALNLDDNVGKIRVWESIKENFETSGKENLAYCKLYEYIPWFGLKYRKLSDHGKEAVL